MDRSQNEWISVLVLSFAAPVLYFVLRLVGTLMLADDDDDDLNEIDGSAEPPKVKYDRIQCPISFKIDERSVLTPNSICFRLCLGTKDLTDIEKICTEFTCKVFWGIRSQSLTKLIYSNLQDFYGSIKCSMDELNALDISNLSLLELKNSIAFGDQIVIHLPETVKWEYLMNTYRYPACLVFYRRDFNPTVKRNLVDRSVNCFFVILHIRNDLVDIPTTVLGRFIKLSDNTTYPIKELYLPDVTNSRDSDEELDEDSDDEESESANISKSERKLKEIFPGVICTVCTSPATITILPCGHLCICEVCMKKLVDHYCPVCRGLIHSYFVTC